MRRIKKNKLENTKQYCIKWLEAGDLNTRLFHLITRIRNASNAIKYMLRVDGSRLKEVHEIAATHLSGTLCNIVGCCSHLPGNHLGCTKASSDMFASPSKPKSESEPCGSLQNLESQTLLKYYF